MVIQRADAYGARVQFVQVFFAVVMLVLAAWFWVHCAKPMLRYRSAGPMLNRLLFAVTAYTLILQAIYIAVTVTSHAWLMQWLAACLPWLLIVGLPYFDEYRFLIRLGRRR